MDDQKPANELRICIAAAGCRFSARLDAGFVCGILDLFHNNSLGEPCLTNGFVFDIFILVDFCLNHEDTHNNNNGADDTYDEDAQHLIKYILSG